MIVLFAFSRVRACYRVLPIGVLSWHNPCPCNARELRMDRITAHFRGSHLIVFLPSFSLSRHEAHPLSSGIAFAHLFTAARCNN